MSEHREINAADWQATVTSIGKVGGWFVSAYGSNVNSETHLMKKNGVVLVLFAKLAVGKPKSKQHMQPYDEWMQAKECNDNIFVATVTPIHARLLWSCLMGDEDLALLEDDER